MATNELTAKEAAARLGVSLRTISNYLERGRFPGAYRLDPLAIKSAWRIPVADVVAFELARKGWVKDVDAERS